MPTGPGCDRCLVVMQSFWDSSTLGPMCLVPQWGLALVFLPDGAQALEERSYRYWEGGGCVVTFGLLKMKQSVVEPLVWGLHQQSEKRNEQ